MDHTPPEQARPPTSTTDSQSSADVTARGMIVEESKTQQGSQAFRQPLLGSPEPGGEQNKAEIEKFTVRGEVVEEDTDEEEEEEEEEEDSDSEDITSSLYEAKGPRDKPFSGASKILPIITRPPKPPNDNNKGDEKKTQE